MCDISFMVLLLRRDLYIAVEKARANDEPVSNEGSPHPAVAVSPAALSSHMNRAPAPSHSSLNPKSHSLCLESRVRRCVRSEFSGASSSIRTSRPRRQPRHASRWTRIRRRPRRRPDSVVTRISSLASSSTRSTVSSSCSIGSRIR